MQKRTGSYTFFNKVSAVNLILTIVWLTVNAPFVLSVRQQLAKMTMHSAANNRPLLCEDDLANPLGNSTEEKAPSSSSFSEEYLHDYHAQTHYMTLSLRYNACENTGIYTAFHGELHVPPPNSTI